MGFLPDGYMKYIKRIKETFQPVGNIGWVQGQTKRKWVQVYAWSQLPAIASSPSFVPAWAPAGTLWDRCRCSSSCSRQSAPSAPRSHSSRSGCPKRTGSWTTWCLGEMGGGGGWRSRKRVEGWERTDVSRDKMVHAAGSQRRQRAKS